MALESDVNEWVVALVDGYRFGDGASVLQALADHDDSENGLLITVDAVLMTISSVRIRELLSDFEESEGVGCLTEWTYGVATGRRGRQDLPIHEWAVVISLAAGDLASRVPTDARKRIALFATLLSIFTEGGTSILMSYDRLRQEGMKLSGEALSYFEQEYRRTAREKLHRGFKWRPLS